MTAEMDIPLDERLRSATQGIVPRHADQTFRRLLGLAPLLRDWREQGYGHAQIHDLLCAEGLICRPGTLRGYIARILKADEAFRNRHGRTPGLSELRTLCRRGGKAQKHPAKPIRSFGGLPAGGAAHARPRRSTTFDETEL